MGVWNGQPECAHCLNKLADSCTKHYAASLPLFTLITMYRVLIVWGLLLVFFSICLRYNKETSNALTIFIIMAEVVLMSIQHIEQLLHWIDVAPFDALKGNNTLNVAEPVLTDNLYTEYIRYHS